MNKIPFDIKYRPEIEAGKYKVVTRDDRPVRIVCWDFVSNKPLIGVIGSGFNDGEVIATYSNMGRIYSALDDSADLFLVPAEPELTEFENALGEEIFDPPFNAEQVKVIRDEAVKLLALAKKELEKDLPRWKKSIKPGRQNTFGRGIGRYPEDGEVVFKNGLEISIDELFKKLPKEE